MKRSIFLLSAVAVACFAIAVATDVIEFTSDRTDRRVVILSVGVVVGLAALGMGSSEPVERDDDLSGRAAAARQLASHRPDPDSLPTKPGSLLKKETDPNSAIATERTETASFAEASSDEPTTTGPDRFDVIAEVDRPVGPPFVERVETAEIQQDVAPFVEASHSTEPEADPSRADAAAVDDMGTGAAPQRAIVPSSPAPAEAETIDHALLELIDDDQMLEISELVAAAEANAEDHPVDDGNTVVAVADSAEPLTRLELRLADYDDDDLQRVVKESEAVVIAEMVRSGQLSSEGELTDQDIASMVFLAYTSEEMLTELRLRKSLDASRLDGRTSAAALNVSAEDAR